jgi:hypothetical protein
MGLLSPQTQTTSGLTRFSGRAFALPQSEGITPQTNPRTACMHDR